MLALYAYNTIFRNFDLSNGAVLAVILLLISLVFTLLLRPAAAEGELSRVPLARRTLLADIGTYLAYCRHLPLLRRAAALARLALDPHRAPRSTSATSASGRRCRRSRTIAAALGNPLFPTYLWNGLKLAVGGALGAMLFATPAAYALSRFRFRNRNLAMIGLLAFQMISPLVIMVPLYRYMDRVGLTDSHVRRRASSTSRSPRRSSPGC